MIPKVSLDSQPAALFLFEPTNTHVETVIHWHVNRILHCKHVCEYNVCAVRGGVPGSELSYQTRSSATLAVQSGCVLLPL